MSKLYFNKGEKDRIKSYINVSDIELIKKDYRYKNIILLNTNIIPVLVDLIIEYTHEIILIDIERADPFIIVTLKNYFSVIIRRLTNTNKYDVGINKGITKKILSSYTKQSKIIDNAIFAIQDKISELQFDGMNYINVFINSYMKKYYGYDKYIDQISCFDDLNEIEQKYCYLRHGQYDVTHYQLINSDSESYYSGIHIVHDHKKLKLMIIIVKLFIDLLDEMRKN